MSIYRTPNKVAEMLEFAKKHNLDYMLIDGKELIIYN